MGCKIDPRAAIADGAQIGADVEIGPFAVIDGNVKIGDRCKIGPHVHLTGHTTIGAGTSIHTGAVIGGEPQDVHYNDEVSYVEVGENCIIREYVTIHRGTEEGSITKVGNRVMLMAMVHLGHNCQIADDVIIANSSLLAGRVQVDEHAFISGGCLVHQYVRIGKMAMVGGGNTLPQDVPPYCLLQYGVIHGPNIVALRRSGLAEDVRDDIRDAIKIFFFEGLNTKNAISEIRARIPNHPEIDTFVDFLENTRRGVMSGRVAKKNFGTAEQ